MPVPQIKSAEDVKELGTILSVWAHPDDESFSCAGIMAAAIANDQRVICITATRGELGIQDESRWPAAKLGDIRSKELKDALNILGITEHFFLDYKDGECDKVPLMEGAAKVRLYIDKYMPNTILTFGPDGMTGHPDHQSVSHWATEAVRDLAVKPKIFHSIELKDRYESFLKKADERLNIYFNIDKPPLVNESDCAICFACEPDLCSKKIAALKAMPSQTEGLMNNFDKATIEAMMACESFVEAKN